MKASSTKLLAAVLALVAGLLAAGCGGGGSGSAEGRELTIGDIGWDESIAMSNLTKVLLEEELGYENVELQTLDVALLFEGVSSGDLDAFQDVWLPNHQEFVDDVQDDTELLEPWYQGTTEFGIAVPDYVDINTIPELNQTEIQEILGIEPGAPISEAVPDETIPTYNLEQEYVTSSTAGMLAEVETRYDNNEPFAFLGWSPHWMNQRYDFHYLEDPEDTLGNLNDGAEIHTIVNEDLPDDDPVAMAFMQALTLNEEQLNELEDTINVAGDPIAGAQQWAEANPDVVQPWLDAAREAQGS